MAGSVIITDKARWTCVVASFARDIVVVTDKPPWKVVVTDELAQ